MLFNNYHFLIVIFFVFQPSIWAALPSAIDSNEARIMIKLKDMCPNNIGYYIPGGSASNDSSMFPIKENIVRLPEAYDSIKTFHLSVQLFQYVTNLATKDEEAHKLLSENDSEFYTSGLSISQYLKSRYTLDYVDCIVSVCVVNNNKDNAEFVVVDINNDEDMTNDPVLSYTTISPRATSESIDQQQKNSVVIDTEVEYYNGRRVVTVKIPIRFSKDIRQEKPYYTYSIDNVKYGVITIDNENFAMLITNLSPDLDYNIQSAISIDIDKDSQFISPNDLHDARLFQPFTFKGKTYRLSEIEPTGNYIILEKADVPPIEVGSPAPDFNSVSIDSVDFRLSENRGKVLLLEFWATWCGPCIGEIPLLKESYANYKDKGFEIIGIGIDDTSKIKSYTQEKGMDWTHICHQSNDIKRLYQVDGIPSSFLISSDGIILAKGAELRGKNLSKTLAEHLK